MDEKTSAANVATNLTILILISKIKRNTFGGADMKNSLLVFCTLFLLLSLGNGFAQELTLYSMPSPREINWESPKGLTVTSLTNRLTFQHIKAKHAIGHVFISLTHKEKDEFVMTGSAPTKDSGMQNMVLKEGYGLGILFADIKGALESSEKLLGELPARAKSGRISFIKFKLSESNYARLKTYLNEYRRRGYGNIYNGLNLPREGKGAGCSAFGVAFLEVAGLMHPVWEKEWPIQVRIPLELIGGPLTGKKVPVTKAMKIKRWATEKEPHRTLKLYEPFKIHEWIVREWNRENKSPSGKVKLLKEGNALGLEYNCTHVQAPEEPIFQGDAAKIPIH